jgi:hypothetical protein
MLVGSELFSQSWSGFSFSQAAADGRQLLFQEFSGRIQTFWTS